MFRLIMALGVAGVLLPAETVKDKSSNEVSVTSQVSTYEVFSAAHSLYADITTFCERNDETCRTGKALASSAAHKITSGLKQITQQNGSQEAASTVDMTHTGAVQK